MGVVQVEGVAITNAMTFTTPADGPVPSWASTLERCGVQVQRLMDVVRCWQPDVLVLEAYEDFGGQHKRGVRNRWMTPVLLGMIVQALEGAEVTVVWQGAGDVMTAYRAHKASWAKGIAGIMPGDNLLGNDHERSAACHAMAYLAGRHTRGW